MEKIKEKFTRKKTKTKEIKRLKNDDDLICLIETEQTDQLQPLLVHKKITFERPLHWDSHIVSETVLPIHVAATLPTSEVLRLFLAYHCPVDLVTASGLTALHFVAVYKGSCLGIIDVLIDDGIDVNAIDKSGRTALHWACERKNHKFVKKMLGTDYCDTSVKDSGGLRALDIARKVNCVQTIKLLEKLDKHHETELREEHRLAEENLNLKRENEKLALENRYLSQSLTNLHHSALLTCSGNPLGNPYLKEEESESSSTLTDEESSSVSSSAHTIGSGSTQSLQRYITRRNSTRPVAMTARYPDVRSKRSPSCPSLQPNPLTANDFYPTQTRNPSTGQILSQERKEIVRENLSDLLGHMKPDNVIVKLFQKNIIDSDTYIKILKMNSSREKNNHILLEVINRGTNNDYEQFAAILEDCHMPSLANILLPENRKGDVFSQH